MSDDDTIDKLKLQVDFYRGMLERVTYELDCVSKENDHFTKLLSPLTEMYYALANGDSWLSTPWVTSTLSGNLAFILQQQFIQYVRSNGGTNYVMAILDYEGSETKFEFTVRVPGAKTDKEIIQDLQAEIAELRSKLS